MRGLQLAKGFSFQVTGGAASGGWHLKFTRLSWRICLGHLAITLFFFDPEPALTKAAIEYARKS